MHNEGDDVQHMDQKPSDVESDNKLSGPMVLALFRNQTFEKKNNDKFYSENHKNISSGKKLSCTVQLQSKINR